MTPAFQSTVMKPGDEARLDAFLRQSPDVSVLLRSNLYNEGLQDAGRRLQGTWLAALDDHGTIVGVAAHFHLGTMVLAAPTHCAQLAPACSEISGRPISTC